MIDVRLAFARLVLELAELVGSEVARAERQVDRCFALAQYAIGERRDANLDTLLAVLDADEDAAGLSFDGACALGRWVCGRSDPRVLIAALSVIELGAALDGLDDIRDRWERG